MDMAYNSRTPSYSPAKIVFPQIAFGGEDDGIFVNGRRTVIPLLLGVYGAKKKKI
jgi:hypothetical protein